MGNDQKRRKKMETGATKTRIRHRLHWFIHGPSGRRAYVRVYSDGSWDLLGKWPRTPATVC